MTTNSSQLPPPASDVSVFHGRKAQNAAAPGTSRGWCVPLPLILLAVIPWMFGCREVHIAPEPPEFEHASSSPSIPDSMVSASSVHVPVEVPFQTIQGSLNKAIPSRLKFNDEVDCPETPLPREHDCKIKGDISLGAARFTGSGNRLAYTREVRGKITFFVKWQIKIDLLLDDFTHTKEEDKNLHFRGTITISSKPEVNRQWEIEPNLSGGVRFSEAYIHFGAPISVRGELTPIANRLLNEHLAEIGRDAQQSLSLRPKVRPIWDRLARPSRLSTDQNIWAFIEPQAAYMGPVRVEEERIRFGLGLDFFARTVIGTIQDPETRPTVPDLSTGHELGSGFRLAVPFTASYSEVSQALNEELQEWESELSEGVHVTVDSVSLYGDHRNVFLKAAFRARHEWTRAEGTLYFRGRPVLDPDEQQLRIADVAFDVRTANVLVRSATWLHRKALVQKLEERLVFDLQPLFDQSLDSVNRRLANLEIDGRLRLRAEVQQASLKTLFLRPDGFILLALAEGTTAAEVFQL
jgi:hypothetical protein